MFRLLKEWRHKLFWCHDMDKAPKNKPLLARIEPLTEKTCPNCDGTYMCLYHGHSEGMDHVRSDHAVIEWGGAFDDRSYEYPNGGYMPDWWFRADGDFEAAANPVAWRLV